MDKSLIMKHLSSESVAQLCTHFYALKTINILAWSPIVKINIFIPSYAKKRKEQKTSKQAKKLLYTNNFGYQHFKKIIIAV